MLFISIKLSENMSGIVDVHKYLYMLFTVILIPWHLTPMSYFIICYSNISLDSCQHLAHLCVLYHPYMLGFGRPGPSLGSSVLVWTYCCMVFVVWLGTWSHQGLSVESGTSVKLWTSKWRHANANAPFSVVILKDEPSYLKPNSVLSVN